MKRYLFKQFIIGQTGIFLLFFSFLINNGFAQETGVEQDEGKVFRTFENPTIINNQTVESLESKTLEFMIQHRFGTLENGFDDAFGLYAPSNIRMGFNYGITDRITVGIGTTKFNLLQDAQLKIKLLEQTVSGNIPLSLSYYGNTVLMAKKDTITFDDFTQRFSYFHQIIIARKFNENFSMQVAPSFMHFNIVDSLKGIKHDNFAISLAGRYKISDQSSIVFEYDLPLTYRGNDRTLPKPNIGLGIEISTISHTFQIFVSSYDAIINQQNIVFNEKDFTRLHKGLLLGFNISRNWVF